MSIWSGINVRYDEIKTIDLALKYYRVKRQVLIFGQS
jgi:hypothetical protein